MYKEELFTKYKFNKREIDIIAKFYKLSEDKVEEYFDNLNYAERKLRLIFIANMAQQKGK